MKLLFHRREIAAGLAALSLIPKAASANAGLRVASLDWALAETMLAIGHNPIAIVAASDWKRGSEGLPHLPADVADLGLQQDLNFELLASLRPDLILTSPFIANLDSVLQQIAKTVRLSIFEKTAVPLDQPRALARTLGELLDRAQMAQAFLAEAEQMLDQYRARIAALKPLPVLLVNFIDARHVRVYAGSGLFQNVLDRIGLTNAWTGATNYWGFATVGIEGLATDRDLRLITFEPIPADAHPTLQRSPLWTKLPFVEAGHVSVLPPVFMFGAMPSALRFASLLVQHLESLSA
jgi:ABC-type Fe3+-hydroxamate transport system substrate-binding protein